MKKIRLFLLLNLIFASPSFADGIYDSLEKVIQGKNRSEENKARDVYRHPLETLKFFALDEYMTVVEIWPGAGWYTEILAPYLQKHGRLYAAHFAADTAIPFYQDSLKKFKKKLRSLPRIYKRVKLTELQPPDKLEIAPPESADRVLTFRNIHNWMASGHTEAVFAAMYKALKPGGLLGIVEHRKPEKYEQDPLAESGYVREDYVINLAESAGFKMLDKSEINANPNDSAIHPEGVWTLPPTLRLKDAFREKYLAIGESDRMTLKFIKPYQKTEPEQSEK